MTAGRRQQPRQPLPPGRFYSLLFCVTLTAILLIATIGGR